MAKKKPLEIDMIAGSQLRDTQGEMLSVEGADISELEAGRGRFNDNHGKGFFNSVGRVTGAKKIFGPEDCTDPRHTYYWEKVKAPYVYVKGYLYDDEEHSNAKAAAAILRNIHKSDTPLKLKASVEGGVVQRGLKDESLLARTKIHSVALTFTPANNATLVEPLSMEKSADQEADMLLIKSVMHLAKENVPSFRSITRNAQAEKIYQNMEKIRELAAEMGMETELVKGFTVEQLVKEAIEMKVVNNVNKINELIKGAPNSPQAQTGATKLEPGSTHEVEVHPHIDHLLKLKNHILSSGQDKLKMEHFKRMGVSKTDLKNVPRDADGWTSPQTIDDHIESLPKTKVNVKVVPYDWGAQLHHKDSKQNLLSVAIHPDEKLHEDEETNDRLKGYLVGKGALTQHRFRGAGDRSHPQMGWARIDDTAGKDHWHVDEIQSDLRNKNNIERETGSKKDADDLYRGISHGHDDPQHFIQSVVNAMARKHNANSISMDTPKDQARQSGLREFESIDEDEIRDGMYDAIEQDPQWLREVEEFENKHFSSHKVKKELEETQNPYLKSAAKKVNLHSPETLSDVTSNLSGSEPQEQVEQTLSRILRADNDIIHNHYNREKDNPNPHEESLRSSRKHMDDESKPKLSEQEYDAVADFFREKFTEMPLFNEHVDRLTNDHISRQGKIANKKLRALPVHQIDTYDKRPKKAGMTLSPKSLFMPDHAKEGEEVQASRVYKNIQKINDLVKMLSAGYGGAGSPTSRTQGSVLQSESLDDGRGKKKGMKYITCDHCGNEQVYMKHQVKCRKCNKHQSLEKLLSVMV
jgi:hypothetical protein